MLVLLLVVCVFYCCCFMTSLYLCDFAAANESCLNVSSKHLYQSKVSSWFLYYLEDIRYLYWGSTMTATNHDGHKIDHDGHNNGLPCGRHGHVLWPSWFVVVIVMAVMVMVCGRHGLWPSLLWPSW